MLPHFGITRIHSSKPDIASKIEHLILKSCVGFAILTNKGHRVPQHILHTHRLHSLDVCRHIFDTHGSNLPIATVGVTAIVVCRLPTVINNYCTHTQLHSLATLRLDIVVGNLLVELIPRRVERRECRLGDVVSHKSVLCSNPLRTLAHSIRPEDIAFIEQNRCLIVHERSFGLHEESQLANQQCTLLSQTEL